jgi:hypothetical protein
VKRYVLAAALALAFGSNAQAAVIDLVTTGQAATTAAQAQVALLAVTMSELPEPEVFAMMLLGLILIGYRARRDSNEKFK